MTSTDTYTCTACNETVRITDQPSHADKHLDDLIKTVGAKVYVLGGKWVGMALEGRTVSSTGHDVTVRGLDWEITVDVSDLGLL